MLNARSLYNKAENFRNMLYQVCPDLSIISETWEKQKTGVKACWALLSPISPNPLHKVKKVVVGSFYVSPKSQYKDETIDYIIQSIHFLRSKFDNNVSFLLGGDLNRLKIEPILDCYGALKQIITVPTREGATLENIITDLHSFYHPPTTLPPLQVDEKKKGKDRDHQVFILAPLANQYYQKPRMKKIVTTGHYQSLQLRNLEGI